MKVVRKLAVISLGMAVFWAALVDVASAQQYKNVSILTPFTAQTNFMSLPGYLRYVSHEQTGQWLTYTEAERIVHQQGGI